MADNVLAQLAALKVAPTLALKAQWRKLFASEPPPYNRRFLESRLAYRVQEFAYGRLERATLQRLEALGEEVAPGKHRRTSRDLSDRPIAGTRLVRGWQGVEHTVIRIEGEFGERCRRIDAARNVLAWSDRELCANRIAS